MKFPVLTPRGRTRRGKPGGDPTAPQLQSTPTMNAAKLCASIHRNQGSCTPPKLGNFEQIRKSRPCPSCPSQAPPRPATSEIEKPRLRCEAFPRFHRPRQKSWQVRQKRNHL